MYIYIYMLPYIYIYICIGIYACVRPCMHACVLVCTHVWAGDRECSRTGMYCTRGTRMGYS